MANQLDPVAKSLLDRQIEQINLTQRHVQDKEVNFYCIKDGKPAFDEKARFPIAREVKLATITLKADGTKLLHADVWLVHGHLFSIEFSSSPKQFDDNRIEITQTRILIDPTKPDGEKEEVK